MTTSNVIETHHSYNPRLSYRESVASLWQMRQGPSSRPPEDSRVRGEIEATVNWGRWIVDCPSRCNSAMLVEPDDPRFACVRCGSPENEGHWYRVVFPADRTALEAELLKRPNVENRGWVPGQRVADLQSENKEHGIN